MRNKSLGPLLLLGLVLGIGSCGKKTEADPPPAPPVTPTDTATTLKGAASFPIGFGIDYTPFISDAPYKATVVREGDNVTFGYDMKHGAIMRNDGTLDFTRADVLYSAANSAGLQVYGHTLVWHQNQNAVYLNSLVTTTIAGPNVLLNGDFESGSGNEFTNWTKYNGSTAIGAGSGAREVHGGTRSFKAVVATSGNAWSVQLASDLFNTTAGTNYKISFWIKAAATGGKIRVSTGPTASYSPDFPVATDWNLVEWTFPAKEAQSRVLLDVGSTTNTYFIDDVSVTSITTVSTGSDPPARNHCTGRFRHEPVYPGVYDALCRSGKSLGRSQ